MRQHFLLRRLCEAFTADVIGCSVAGVTLSIAETASVRVDLSGQLFDLTATKGALSHHGCRSLTVPAVPSDHMNSRMGGRVKDFEIVTVVIRAVSVLVVNMILLDVATIQNFGHKAMLVKRASATQAVTNITIMHRPIPVPV